MERERPLIFANFIGDEWHGVEGREEDSRLRNASRKDRRNGELPVFNSGRVTFLSGAACVARDEVDGSSTSLAPCVLGKPDRLNSPDPNSPVCRDGNAAGCEQGGSVARLGAVGSSMGAGLLRLGDCGGTTEACSCFCGFHCTDGWGWGGIRRIGIDC